MLKAAICTIGDEILIGQVLDTNSQAISKSLESIGVRTETMLSVGDDTDEIISGLRSLLNKHDIVIATGGLGPTKDDITKKSLAAITGAKSWHIDEEQEKIIVSMLDKRGIAHTRDNLNQALVPDSSEVIINRCGMAPITVYRLDEELFANRPVLYSLPGVPHEAIGALPDITADIRRHFSLTDIYHKTIVTFGIPESIMSDMLSDWEDKLPEDMKLAYLPDTSIGLRLRLSIYGGKREEEEARINDEFAKLVPVIGDSIYGSGNDTLESVIGDLLRRSGKTLSAAESCTGGMISARITSVAGSSEYYLGSVTSYSNSVKQGVLGVNQETIERFGAVSEQCVKEMAKGVRRITGSDFSVATSGIAGPGGGVPGKPVGTVWIGISSPDRTIAKKMVFTGDRKRNVISFASNALNLLRLEIEKYTSGNTDTINN